MTEPTRTDAELLERIAAATEDTARSVATLRTIAMVGVYGLGGIVVIYLLVSLVSWRL